MSDILVPPFTFRQLAEGVSDATAIPGNETQVMRRPRASGIMNDAREIAYKMAGTPVSNERMAQDDRWQDVMAAETGRMLEDLMCLGIMNLRDGLEQYAIVDRQVELPEDYPMSGHPDGRLVRRTKNGFKEMPGGKRVGIEFKVKGSYQFKNLAADGIHSAIGRDLLAQVTTYGDALKWDSVVIVVMSHDAGPIRNDVSRFKKYAMLKKMKEDQFHAKGFVWAVDLTELKEALAPMLHKRADWFSRRQAAGKDPRDVRFEKAPTERQDFPWGWSEYYDLAHADLAETGTGTKRAPWPALLRKGY